MTIVSTATDIIDEMENATNVSKTVNQRISDVNTEESLSSPSVSTFWTYDIPAEFVESELPALYVQTGSFDREPEWQGQAQVVPDIEVGCLLDTWPPEDWRKFSTVIAESVCRVLDEIRGFHGFGQNERGRHRVTLSGWARPGDSAPAWGGFIINTQLRKAHTIT